MLIKRMVILALATFLSITAVGCGEKKPVQESETLSLTCADLDQVQDSAKRQELSNRCLREGQFKPSTGRKW